MGGLSPPDPKVGGLKPPAPYISAPVKPIYFVYSFKLVYS